MMMLKASFQSFALMVITVNSVGLCKKLLLTMNIRINISIFFIFIYISLSCWKQTLVQAPTVPIFEYQEKF